MLARALRLRTLKNLRSRALKLRTLKPLRARALKLRAFWVSVLGLRFLGLRAGKEKKLE